MNALPSVIYGTRGHRCSTLLPLTVVVLGAYGLPGRCPAAQVEASTQEGVLIVRHGPDMDKSSTSTDAEVVQAQEAPRTIAIDDLLVFDGRLNLRRLGDVRQEAQPDYAADDRARRRGTFLLLPEVRRQGSQSGVTTRLALLRPGGGISLYQPPNTPD